LKIKRKVRRSIKHLKKVIVKGKVALKKVHKITKLAKSMKSSSVTKPKLSYREKHVMKKQKKFLKKTKAKVTRLSEKVDEISTHINVLKTRLDFAVKNKLEDRKAKLTKVLEKIHKKLMKTQSKYTRTIKNASKKKHVIKLIKSKGLVKRFKHVVRSVITKIRLVKISIVSIQTIIVKKTILIKKYIKQIKTMPKKSVKAQTAIA
jgi:hypothetical protein